MTVLEKCNECRRNIYSEMGRAIWHTSDGRELVMHRACWWQKAQEERDGQRPKPQSVSVHSKRG